MSDHENPMGSVSTLKQKLLEALQTTIAESGDEVSGQVGEQKQSSLELTQLELNSDGNILPDGRSVYSLLVEEVSSEGETPEAPLPEELQESRARLMSELEQIQRDQEGFRGKETTKSKIDDTLSMRGVVPDAQTETHHPAGAPSSSSQATHVKSNSVISGGSMADLSGYKDLSKAPTDVHINVGLHLRAFPYSPGLSPAVCRATAFRSGSGFPGSGHRVQWQCENPDPLGE
jgi:hypothetical protein